MNYYEVLEVSPKASQEVIRNAYRTLAKKYHPDVYQADKQHAEEQMKLINEAYDTLSNPQTRFEYDKKLEANSKDNNQISNEPVPDEISDEEMNVASYIIVIVICVSIVCCALYFLPEIIAEAWGNICTSVKEILESFNL